MYLWLKFPWEERKSTKTKGRSYKGRTCQTELWVLQVLFIKNHTQRAELLTMRRHRSYSKLEVHHAKSMASSHTQRQDNKPLQAAFQQLQSRNSQQEAESKKWPGSHDQCKEQRLVLWSIYIYCTAKFTDDHLSLNNNLLFWNTPKCFRNYIQKMQGVFQL